jgi:hypothetical protein
MSPEQLQSEIEITLTEFLFENDFADCPENRRVLKSVIEDGYSGIYSRGNLKQAASDVENKLVPKDKKKSYAELQVDIDKNNRKIHILENVLPQLYPLLRLSQRNFDIMDEWFDRHLNGWWSAEALPACIYQLTGKLSFDEPAPPPPAPEVVEEPQGPVENLRSWQLPLDASEWQIRQADKHAVKDLLQRRRALQANQPKPINPHRIGSSF